MLIILMRAVFAKGVEMLFAHLKRVVKFDRLAKITPITGGVSAWTDRIIRQGGAFGTRPLRASTTECSMSAVADHRTKLKQAFLSSFAD
jgi:hypothetical protein